MAAFATASHPGLDMSEHDHTRPGFLIDMDGVLVHEDDLIPGADRVIKSLRQAGAHQPLTRSHIASIASPSLVTK